MDGAPIFEKAFEWMRWSQDKHTVSYCLAIGQVRGEHVMLQDVFEEDDLVERRELDKSIRVEFEAR